MLLPCAAVVPAFAANPGWVNRVWNLEDGLPDSFVSGLAETSDGYLWVGTLGGLVRFDGVKFQEVPLKLESQTVQAMLVDRKDRLWLAMDRGPVVCLGEGEYRVYTLADGVPNTPLRKLVEDGQGAIWVASLSSQLLRIKDGRVTRFGQESGVPSGGVASLACDKAGQLWLCKGGRLGVLREERFWQKSDLGDNDAFIASAGSGGIWVYASNQLFKCRADAGLDKWTDLVLGAGAMPKVILEDRAGSVWLGTVGDGLFRCDGTRCERVRTSHPGIACLSEDEAGNIWAGTGGGGLNRLRPRVLELLGREAGLPFESVTSIRGDATGSLWLVTQNGLLARQNGDKWIQVPNTNGWAGAHATCVTADQKGAIWIGTSDSGLFSYQNGLFTARRMADGLPSDRVQSILAASNGDLWLATFWPNCLQRLHEGGWRIVKLPEGEYSIRAMTEDTNGTVWLGSSDGKLLRVDVPHETVSVQREGDSIRCLWSTPDGTVWIGHAHIGLGVLREGRYSLISSREGLRENAVSQILSDDRGWLWMAGTRGLSRVRQRELDEIVAGRATRVFSVADGYGEGLANMQANFDFFPGAMRGRKGLLWFPMRNGLLAVHTENIGENHQAPPVLLEQVMVDDQPVAQSQQRVPQPNADKLADLRAAGATLNLPPTHHKLEFKFTALSFVAPDQIVFRYRLEGVDEKWVEAGAQRTATYSRLLAGKYKFRVAACDDAGVWNEAEPLMIVVKPFFWQTWWFGLGSVIGFAAVVGFSMRFWANRRLRRRLASLMQQQALEKERARIARDLHDDLGASLAQIGFAMEEFRENSFPAEELERQTMLLGGRVHSLARDLDAVVWSVNPRNDSLTELVAYLSQYFLEGFRPTPIRTRLEVDDDFPKMPISPEARHHLFLAAKEAMNNVMKHSGATEVWLKMSVANSMFELRVEDNGRGFSMDAAAASKRQGLRNIKSRTEEVGGSLEVLSPPGKGTSIVVRVLLATMANSKTPTVSQT